MRRTHSLGKLGALTSKASHLSFGKNRLRRPKRIFYKLSGFPEGKVGQLKKYWNVKARDPTSEYDRNEKQHRQSLQDVLAQPYEEKAVMQCLCQMLSSREHPYGMVVADFGREIINSFEGGDMGAVLDEIKSRLETFSNSMSGTAFLQYKDILAGVTPEEFSLLCQDAMYEALLDREPNVILDYYHMKFARQDHAICSLSEAVASRLTPAHMEVSSKFWLITKNGHMPPPYCAAISILQQLPHARSPLAKVAVVKDAARSICMSIEQFWDVNRADFPRGEDPSVSADDLVAIFSYVIIKSKVQLLYSESQYICDFISDRNLMGETGYLITTLQCCCISLASLEPSELMKVPK